MLKKEGINGFENENEFARHYVQFKWYHLSDDIIETMALYRK